MSPGRQVEVESSGIIDAPLEKLWDLVSDFSNVAHWHPDVTECPSRIRIRETNWCRALSASAQRNLDSGAITCHFASGSLLHVFGNRVATADRRPRVHCAVQIPKQLTNPSEMDCAIYGR